MKNILNYCASVDKVTKHNGSDKEVITEKKCSHCGCVSPLSEWHLTMDFKGAWKCQCPKCNEWINGL